MIDNLTLQSPPWSRACLEPLPNELIWSWNSPNAAWQKLEVKNLSKCSIFKRFTGNIIANMVGIRSQRDFFFFFSLERASSLLFLPSGTVVIYSLSLSNQITLIFCCLGLNKYFQDKLC